MANKLFAEVVIAGSYKNLAKSTRGATKELTMFEKSAKKISTAITGALAGIVAIGIGQIWDGLVDMTKAAAADAKSMALLNKQLDNSWKVTDKTYKAVDDYINSVSNMSGILDDDLRPAFSKIAAVSKGSTKSFKAFNLVMDISAGTGKDVNSVANAMAKYIGGNKKALDKFVPGLKDATDKIGFLKDKYTGMAQVAGANDPFARIAAVFDNFKEKLGLAFLPMVQQVADWLAGPDAQAAMDQIAKWVQDAFAFFTSPEGQAAIADWYEKIKELLEKALDLANKMQAITDPFGWFGDQFKSIDKQRGQKINAMAKNKTSIGDSATMYGTGGTRSAIYNVTVNGVVSGNDVVKALKTVASRKGQTLAAMLK